MDKVLEGIDKKKKISATLGTMNLVGLGAVGGLAAVGLSHPAGPVIIGLSIAVAFLLRQVALVKELSQDLISIQLELDRMETVYNVIEQIAKENDIFLDTRDLNKWLTKILRYILSIVPKDAMKEIINTRELRAFDISEFKDISLNTSQKPSLMKSIGRWFAPGEYITILMNDFTRVIGSFTILVTEFNIILMSKNATSEWVNSEAFKLLLSRNKGTETRIISEDAINTLVDAAQELEQINPMITRLHNDAEETAELEKTQAIVLGKLMRSNNRNTSLPSYRASRKLINNANENVYEEIGVTRKTRKVKK